MYLGVEIGGTKLQLAVGTGDGTLARTWRGRVDPARGADGIREQIQAALPQVLATGPVKAAGIGFGGPVDDATATALLSHQIAGWDGFPLARWLTDVTGLPTALGNDADVAGLGEACHGAGKGMSPLFYMNIGSGIGGCLVLDGEIYRGCGRGAAEVGHLVLKVDRGERKTLESLASGWAMTEALEREGAEAGLAEQVARGDQAALEVLSKAASYLADGLCHVITLLCPRRIVIGGGVSLLGEELLFVPLRRLVAERGFRPFAGLTDIVPAALGEEVVLHGAIELARRRYG
jgi:glucokinase